MLNYAIPCRNLDRQNRECQNYPTTCTLTLTLYQSLALSRPLIPNPIPNPNRSRFCQPMFRWYNYAYKTSEASKNGDVAQHKSGYLD